MTKTEWRENIRAMLIGQWNFIPTEEQLNEILEKGIEKSYNSIEEYIKTH